MVLKQATCARVDAALNLVLEGATAVDTFVKTIKEELAERIRQAGFESVSFGVVFIGVNTLKKIYSV